jgi:hypothetical protein
LYLKHKKNIYIFYPGNQSTSSMGIILIWN